MTNRISITDTGAIGDGQTTNTAAVQEALDRAAAAGGGEVIVPCGTFITGTLQVKDNTTIRLEAGGVLKGSSSIKDYPPFSRGHNKDRQPHHLIVCNGASNVTLCGEGTIDGSGQAFWESEPSPSGWYIEKPQRPSPMLEFVGCRNLRLSDVTLRNSPGWTCHLHDCDVVAIRGVSIINDMFGPNTDGFDINGSHDVIISDCFINTGDDAVCLKTTPDSRTCERVTVTNCVIQTNCVGLKLGCNESFKDMRQVTFNNCIVYKSTRAVGLYSVEGATLEDIVVSNIVCDTDNNWPLNRPVHIDLRRRENGSSMGRIRNVQISNFIARTNGRILMTAEKGGLLENIVLRDIRLSYESVDDPYPRGLDAGGSQFSNRSREARAARAAIVMENAQDLVLSNVAIDWPETPDNPPMRAVWGRGVQNGVIDAPLAKSSLPAIDKYDLKDCALAIRA